MRQPQLLPALQFVLGDGLQLHLPASPGLLAQLMKPAASIDFVQDGRRNDPSTIMHSSTKAVNDLEGNAAKFQKKPTSGAIITRGGHFRSIA
jgi:hypothetical protein